MNGLTVQSVTEIIARHRVLVVGMTMAVSLAVILLLMQRIPLKYTLRNLRARWVTSLMTVIGTALVVWASVLAFGLGAGLDHTLEVSGDPYDLIVLRKGATSETGSIVDAPRANEIAAMSEVATDGEGRKACSPERVVVINTPRRQNRGNANVIVRGLGPVGYRLRPGFELAEGRMPVSGIPEAIASRSMAERFEGAGLGEKLKVMRSEFEIVGIFEAGDSAAESEIWTDLALLNQASDAATEQAVLSSVQVRANGPEASKTLAARLTNDEQFGLAAKTEEEYFADQASAGVFIKVLGGLISVILTIGAAFAVANTMFGAVLSRSREVGTLRALGFSRLNVMTSFMLEAIVLCLLGGILGCLATLPLNGLSTGTANWATFSEITFAFRFGWLQLVQGTTLAVMMGLVGGFFPAFRATRMKIVNALRETG